jgi:hypothetical protein
MGKQPALPAQGPAGGRRRCLRPAVILRHGCGCALTGDWGAVIRASTANFLKSYGSRRSEPWGEGTGSLNVLLEWCKARVYDKTIAAFAKRLAARSQSQ